MNEAKTIYLDHAATTPMHPQVIEAMTAIMQDTFGNPSSIHGFGRHAHEKLETARQIIADSLQANLTRSSLTVGNRRIIQLS